jgi:hypothetical protein
MKRELQLAALFALNIGLASAEEPPTAAPAASADRIICSTERVTGSNLPRKVCLSAAEREARRQSAQQAMSSAARKTPARGGGM